MLQRKQSLWLLIAALLNAGVFYFDLYRFHYLDNGTDTVGAIRVPDHYPSLLIAVVITVLPLIAIFMYGNRKRQLRLTLFGMLAEVSFIGMLLMRVGNIDKIKVTPPPFSGSYWIGAVLPVIAIIFLILAAVGIKKDDNLVRSMDRLR